MQFRRILQLVGALLVVLFVLLFTTQPASIPPVLLVAPFVLLFGSLALVLYVGMRTRMPRGRSLWLSLLCAAALIMLLALQSLGQLSWRDAVTVVVIFVVAYIYITRMAISPER